MAVPKPRRRTTASGSAPANLNHAPQSNLAVNNKTAYSTNPRYSPEANSIADNINAAPTRRNRQPIKHKHDGKTYTLRYKSPAKWEEFGRLNSHIDPKFWDSPIHSREENFADSPIHTVESPLEKLRGRFSRTQNTEPTYGYDQDLGRPISDVEFAKKQTEVSLLMRKERAKLKKWAKDEKKMKKQVASNLQQEINYYQQQMYRSGKITGQAEGIKKLVGKAKGKAAARVAHSIIMGWYSLGQLILFGIAVVLIGAGLFMLAGVSGATDVVTGAGNSWLRYVPILGPLVVAGSAIASTFGESIAMVSVPFLGAGFAVALLNAVISIAVMMAAWMFFAFTGVKAVGGKQKGLIKKLLFTTAIIGYIFPFTQFVPWAIIWTTYVGINPE